MFRPHLLPSTKAFYRNLWLELKRQRALLIQTTIQEVIQACDATLLSDLLDQASTEQEQELSLLVKERSREKLRQIDIALERMEQRRYGLCVRCEQEIPFARLRIQPAASHCVPCQALDESRLVTTKGLQYVIS
jgi:RNA polymerase-binding protein DksA